MKRGYLTKDGNTWKNIYYVLLQTQDVSGGTNKRHSNKYDGNEAKDDDIDSLYFWNICPSQALAWELYMSLPSNPATSLGGKYCCDHRFKEKETKAGPRHGWNSNWRACANTASWIEQREK